MMLLIQRPGWRGRRNWEETESAVGYMEEKKQEEKENQDLVGFRGLTWTHERVQGRAGCGCCRGKEGEAIRKHSRVPKSLSSFSSSPKSNHHLHSDFLLLFYFFGEMRLLDELTDEINVVTFFVWTSLILCTYLTFDKLNRNI